MKKSEIVEDILTVIKWHKETKSIYGARINVALGKVVWYESFELMKRGLMRQTIANLQKIRTDIVEAIY